MLKQVIVLSRSGMEAFVESNPDGLETHRFISIIDGDSARIFDADSLNVITLVFDDIHPEFSIPVGEREYILFSEAHADQIIDFIVKLKDDRAAETLYVHCRAGISRSGAVGQFVQNIFELDATRFAQDNPGILPNQYILQLLRKRWQVRFGSNKHSGVE